MLSLQKKIIFSLFSENGGNSLKRTYVGGVQVKRTGTNRGGRGSKIGHFERTYFLNATVQQLTKNP